VRVRSAALATRLAVPPRRAELSRAGAIHSAALRDAEAAAFHQADAGAGRRGPGIYANWAWSLVERGRG
jgi:hypothetical protein